MREGSLAGRISYHVIEKHWNEFVILFFQPPNNEFFYEGAGDEKASEYFEVDAESGDIFVKKSLLTDSDQTKNYRVSSLEMT